LARSKTSRHKPTKAPLDRTVSDPDEESLRSVMNAIDILSGVLVWRPDSSLYLSNQRAADIAGRPIAPGINLAQAIAACRILLAGTAELYPPLKLLPPATFQGTGGSFSDAEIARPDGQRRAIEEWTAPIQYSSGKLNFALTVLMDGTERPACSK